MNPHKTIADHQAQLEAAEAEDGPHVLDSDPARTQKALRLLELVERFAERQTGLCLAEIEIFPPYDGSVWEIDCDFGGSYAPTRRGDTLAEAVEAALEELARG